MNKKKKTVNKKHYKTKYRLKSLRDLSLKKMTNWSLIIYCGLITFFARFFMIALIKKKMFNDRVREVLSYVPSAIFPAIIFPAVFLDNSGVLDIESNPKIIAAIIATIIGVLSKNILATIFSGLIAYWIIIFF